MQFLFLFYIIFPNLITSIRFFFFFFFFFFSWFFSPPYVFSFFFLFLFLLDYRTLSTVIRNREIKNMWLLAPPLIEGQRQALSHFCSTVGQKASVSFFFFFWFYCYDLINFKIVLLSLYFDYAWVYRYLREMIIVFIAVVNVWLRLSLEIFERKDQE